MLVSIRSVCKRYRLDEIEVSALEDVNLDIPSRAFTVIAGPSGSGKTTLLNLIGCIDVPDSGSILFDNKDVLKIPERELTRLRMESIGYIFQSFNLIPVLSARENVEYPLVIERVPAAERTHRVRESLEEVGLTEHADKRPNQLSGGQRQRVAIARAMVKRPKLILADEPTANLDSATGRRIIQLMRRLQESHGVTFIFSSHDMNVIAEADEHITLKDGRVAA
jgi:putative ABC transport system ATP-binding protein